MANSSIVIPVWQSNGVYQTYEATAGIATGTSLSSYGPPYWSTVQNNMGHNPSGSFIYGVTSYGRSQDLATVTIAYTGSTPPQFARGSLYAFTGMPDPLMNATGILLDAAPSYSVTGYQLQFINPGPDNVGTVTFQGALNCPEPTWTTGFFWSPTYGSQWDTQQAIIKAQFEAGYAQRSPQGIASNTDVWTLAFNDRPDIEVKGLMAWVQNMQGVYAAPILIPPSSLYNDPTILYVLANPKVTTRSFNQSDVQVVATQVFQQ